METVQIKYFNDQFQRLQAMQPGLIANIRNEGFQSFNKQGIPTIKNEEWKYTGINSLFKKEFQLGEDIANAITKKDIDARLAEFVQLVNFDIDLV